jgi:peptidoglycan glycosyltransferase
MTLERRAWNIARVITILLVLASLRIIYWQMVRGDELKPVAVDLVQAAEEYDRVSDGNPADTRSAVDFLTGVSTVKNLESLPQPVIQRTKDLLETITRGAIYDRSGRLLVSDRIGPDGKRFRFYSEPSLAHVVGYVSGLRTGVAGLELHYNNTLLGLDRPDAQVEQMLNKPITGSDLNLTIDSAVQRAAERALEDRAGAVLVLDGKTGAVLAMASQPRFDPNRILDGAYVAELEESCDGSPNCRAPFLNRATQALYPPGSTWKTIPLIAALDTGQVAPDTIFDFGEPVQGGDGLYYIYQVDGGIIPDPNHQEQQLNLELSYAKSANAAFARIGDEMPADVLIDYAARFGFGAPGEFHFPLEIEYTPSQLAQDVNNLYDNNLLRAVTAIGQGELLTSPLNIGMIVLSVLNDGDMPLPYLVQSVHEPSGSVNEELLNRRVIEDVMKPETAQQVRQMMLGVVEKGSGQKAQVPGLIVGGKTGTAQVGGDQLPHAWFVGFAQDENRSVVVVVLVENGGEGSQAAAPVFAQVVESAMRHAGEAVEEIVPTPVPAPTATAEAAQETEAPATSSPAATEQTREGPPTEGSPTEGAAETPTAIPAPAETATPVPGSVPPPDIPRDADKNDLTAANPSCANPRDMPQATGEFIWPSPYQALSGGDFREGHPGLDLSSPPGSPVHAADTGLVIFAGWSGLGYGNAVFIDHGNGFQTLYGHLSQVSIYCGAKVEKGKLIGLSGDTGNSSGPHLHFEVRVPGGYLNPLTVLPTP